MDYVFISYGLTFIALIITLLAQAFVSGSYSRYSKIKNEKGLTGREVARYILDQHGLYDIDVVETGGYLSDHYDPRNNRKIIIDNLLLQVFQLRVMNVVMLYKIKKIIYFLR